MTTVQHLLDHKDGQVWYLNTQATVKDALELMAQKSIGAVLVMEGDQIAGIFSERDYVARVAISGNLSLDTPISQVMTHPVYYASPEQTLEECMSLMVLKHFRHLPVLKDNRLIGLVSIGDVVRDIIEDEDTTIQVLENYFLGRGFNQ
jgi:CBS domain-containing protein